MSSTVNTNLIVNFVTINNNNMETENLRLKLNLESLLPQRTNFWFRL